MYKIDCFIIVDLPIYSLLVFHYLCIIKTFTLLHQINFVDYFRLNISF